MKCLDNFTLAGKWGIRGTTTPCCFWNYPGSFLICEKLDLECNRGPVDVWRMELWRLSQRAVSGGSLGRRGTRLQGLSPLPKTMA